MALFHGVINSKALMKDMTLSMIVPSDDRKKYRLSRSAEALTCFL